MIRTLYKNMPSTTRDNLLDRARELFNERGLEAVGVRDLARDLGLSPGNVSYWFAKKQDLVEALMEQLAERNARTVRDLGDAADLADLLARHRETFVAQYDYRFLGRAVVHLLETYPDLAARYRATEIERRRGLTTALSAMVGHDLRADTDERTLARIVATFTLTARFWLGEVRLSFDDAAPDRVIDHYLAVLAHALWPPATPRGRRSLSPFLDGVLTAETLGRHDAAGAVPQRSSTSGP